jgi:hypothetical protein
MHLAMLTLIEQRFGSVPPDARWTARAKRVACPL